MKLIDVEGSSGGQVVVPSLNPLLEGCLSHVNCWIFTMARVTGFYTGFSLKKLIGTANGSISREKLIENVAGTTLAINWKRRTYHNWPALFACVCPLVSTFYWGNMVQPFDYLGAAVCIIIELWQAGQVIGSFGKLSTYFVRILLNRENYW